MRFERIFVAFALSGLAGFAGCAHTRLAGSAVDAQYDPARELDYWQALEQKPLLTNHDALHGLLLLADGKDAHVSFTGRLDEARARGWIDADAADGDDTRDESVVANEAATIGFLSVAICQILGIEGGVTLRTFGPSQRYCTRELIFAEILPERSPEQVVRGIEFLDLAGRVEDWRADHASVAGDRP